MSINTANSGPIAPDVFADGEAIIEAIAAGRRPEPDVLREVREREANTTEEIRRKHGVLDIGVPAIRELRDCE